MTLTPGTRLGPYEFEAAISAGSMGEVYEAKDAGRDRSPAVLTDIAVREGPVA
jgi:hypothetical protein